MKSVSAKLALALHLGMVVGYPQAARSIAQNAFQSVVLLIMEDQNSQPVALGSGFVVADGVVATNMHVIAGASGGYAKLVGQTQKMRLTGVLGRDERHDLALLRVSGLSASPLSLGDSDAASVGDDVFVVGNPRGLEGTLSTGVISGIRSVGEDKLLQISAPISPGSSGGPVLDGKGRVIGIAVASFRDGQNLNFAVPSAYLTALLLGSGKAPLPFQHGSPKTRSVVDEFGGSSVEAVQVTSIKLSRCSQLIFSLVNKLDRPIKNTVVLLIFKDEAGAPIDSATQTCFETILPGLAKRQKAEPLTPDGDIVRSFLGHQRFEEGCFSGEGITLSKSELGFVEIRVLTFEVVEEN
jgi:hypothetical protein